MKNRDVIDSMFEFRDSPVHISLDLLSKKWTVDILSELLTGRKRYSELLEINPSISSKVLSERLKELYKEEIIDKIVTNIMPLKAKYQLTEKGRLLKNILFELAVFTSLLYPEKIFEETGANENEIIDFFGSNYNIDEEEVKLVKKRYLSEK
ncbi:MAG: winged helix-turn-helix transcriptional regulator [Candidatus Hodarchaeales archaeon]